MTITETFNKYFKAKLIGWGIVAIIAISIRQFTKPSSLLFIVWFIFFANIVALILGLLDYNFYEKRAPKIILELLDKSPLKEFTKLGFVNQDNNRLVGKINDFQVSLAPLTTSNREHSLVILIPLKPKEGLEDYFTKFDDHFAFTISGNVIFAEAIISNYDKEYHFEKLNTLLLDTTQNIKNKDIQMIEVYDDSKYSS